MRTTGNFNKNYTYIITTIFALFLINLFMPLDGFAKDSDNSDTLILLGNENLAPIVYDHNGTAKGVAVDIAKAIGDRIGYDIKVIPVNWEQAQMMVLNGEADGLLQINPSLKRDEIYDFSCPLLKSEFSIFVENSNSSLRSIDDLKGKKVGVEAGGYPSTILREYEEIDIVTIYDWKTSFINLSNGHLDAIIADRWIGEYELALSRITGIKVVEEPIETQYSRIAVKKGDIETLELINSGLIDLTEDGTVDRIMKQWQGKRVVYITEDYYRTLLLRSILLILLSVTIVVIYLLIKYQRLSKKLRDSVNERTEELNRVNNMLIAANVILEQISMIDGLTSIENRRAFDIAYQKTWRLCMRERMPLALIMIDIDHFKVFNDTYGHLAGDQALIRIAEAIKDVIRRPGDLAARYGGEEFVVMLMNTNGEGVEIVAEKIRRKVEELGIKNEKINTVLTVSLGVASIIPNDKMAAEKIIDSADKALYKAKEDGRNKIVVWQHQQE